MIEKQTKTQTIELLPAQIADLQIRVMKTESTVSDIRVDVAEIKSSQNACAVSVDGLCKLLSKWKEDVEDDIEILKDFKSQHVGGYATIGKTWAILGSIGAGLIGLAGLAMTIFK